MDNNNSNGLKEVDEIRVDYPKIEGIDIDGEKPIRTVVIHGLLESGERFKFEFTGDFKINYMTRKGSKVKKIYEEK